MDHDPRLLRNCAAPIRLVPLKRIPPAPQEASRPPPRPLPSRRMGRLRIGGPVALPEVGEGASSHSHPLHLAPGDLDLDRPRRPAQILVHVVVTRASAGIDDPEPQFRIAPVLELDLFRFAGSDTDRCRLVEQRPWARPSDTCITVTWPNPSASRFFSTTKEAPNPASHRNTQSKLPRPTSTASTITAIRRRSFDIGASV